MVEMTMTIGKLLNWLARIEYSSTSYSINASPFQGNLDSGMIEIQLQDDSGNWRTFHVTQNVSAMIIASMRQLSSQYPGKRIRAVNTTGRVVDIL